MVEATASLTSDSRDGGCEVGLVVCEYVKAVWCFEGLLWVRQRVVSCCKKSFSKFYHFQNKVNIVKYFFYDSTSAIIKQERLQPERDHWWRVYDIQCHE